MEPPTPFKQIDLLTTVRSNFKFASNKLDHVTTMMEFGRKEKHNGMKLWLGCMDGEEKSWNLMKRYNIKDVRLMEPVYRTLRPWIKNHPNFGLYKDAKRPTCRNCGSTKVKKNGVEHTNVCTYQRYKCTDCGANLRGRQRAHKVQEGVLV